MTRPGRPGEVSAPLVCGRILSADAACDRPASWHLMISFETGENGLCCDECFPISAVASPAEAWHPYDPICSIGGALWVTSPDGASRCIVDELPEATLARMAAEQVRS